MFFDGCFVLLFFFSLIFPIVYLCLIICLCNFADVLLKTIPTETHCNWFSKVMNLYQLQKSSSKKPSMHLYAFALKYLAILVKCSDRLVELAKSNTIQLIINTLNVKSNIKESSIFNAYMALLQSLNTHKEGVEYVFQESNWFLFIFYLI